MDTRKFQKTLLEGIVTDEMLALAIQSYDCRAKNFRDKERAYAAIRQSHTKWHDRFGNEDLVAAKKNEYLAKKEELLAYKHPDKVHVLPHYNSEGELMSTEYFFHYEISGISFHSHITEEQANESKLAKEGLHSFTATGAAITTLLSVQFAEKIRVALASGKCKI